jgi:phage terminase large subunit-like protein
MYRLKVFFWMPGDALHKKADQDRVPYIAWRDAGYLSALPGRAINKLAVLHDLSAVTERYDLQGIAYDRWRIEDLIMLANQEGIDLPDMKPFGQGFKEMAPALDTFEELLLNRQIRHNGNPVLTWNAANAVTMSDPANNRKIAKDKATGRVDGIVAAVMACGITSSEDSSSVYESRGVIVV